MQQSSKLDTSNEEYQFISLADLRVGGCRGCVLCAGDNRCKYDDEWLAIGEAMLQADAIDVDRSVDEQPVSEYIKMMMLSNKMSFVGSVSAAGYSQCYTCGYGIDCAVGNMGKILGSILKATR